MWAWRAFIFSLSIALFAAISSPARALENSSLADTHSACNFAEIHSELHNLNSVNTNTNFISTNQGVLSNRLLTEPRRKSNKQANTEKGEVNHPDKAPVYHVRLIQNVSLPPFERQAVSTFGSAIQTEPNFVLIYEFHPEILGLKYYLAPLTTNVDVPWYVRLDAPISHSRVAGWKDGNTLYSGTLTYLS